MSNIRVTYSGFIAFTVALISVITGLFFTLMVTRRLSPEEFGTWAIIGSLISYFLIVELTISFWTTRQIARGENVGKTSFLSSIVVSSGLIPIFIVVAFLFSEITNIDYDVMIFATILLPLTLVSQTLTGINLGHKPHAISYSLLIFESLKIPTALLFVIILDLGLVGAIAATIIAYCGKIILQSYFARNKIKGKFNFSTLYRWIKLSWIPVYSNIASLIWSLDVIVYSLITGSVIGVAYYAASVSITALIAHSGMISQALYPKLLAKGGHDFIKENLNQLLYFSIFLLGISILFAKPALFALNPVYKDASLIVIFFAFRTFFYVITGVLYKILMGLETVDLNEKQTYRMLAKSKLFYVPTLVNIHYISYILIIIVTIFILNQQGIDELEMVVWWSVIALSLQIPFFIYATYLVKKETKISFPIIRVIKYIFGIAVCFIVYFLTSDSLIEYHISIYDYLPGLILEFLLCSIVYFIITYFIDKNTRNLFKSILTEIRRK